MLELYHETTEVAGDDGEASLPPLNEPKIRPIFVMPGVLETKWFKLSAERDWFVFFRNPDEYLALLEVDLNASEFATAVGTLQGKTVKQVEFTPTLARDFNEQLSLLSYIDPERKFK